MFGSWAVEARHPVRQRHYPCKARSVRIPLLGRLVELLRDEESRSRSAAAAAVGGQGPAAGTAAIREVAPRGGAAFMPLHSCQQRQGRPARTRCERDPARRETPAVSLPFNWTNADALATPQGLG